MDWLIYAGIAVVVLIIGFVGQRVGWVDMTNKARSSGTASGAFGALDEVFSPTRHEAQIELDRQTMLPAPAPLPGDGPARSARQSIYEGQVKIDLPLPDEMPDKPGAKA